jgi:hypothetical protein
VCADAPPGWWADQPINSVARFREIEVTSDPHPSITQPIESGTLPARGLADFPPVIISDAMTTVYIVNAVWMPVTVVPTSTPR